MLSHDSHASDELLIMYLEGELPPRAARPVEEHLAACEKCRARRQELERSTADFIEAYRQEFDRQLPASEGPRAMLKAQLAANTEAAGNEPWGWFAARRKPLAAAACLAGLLVIGFFAARMPWRNRTPVGDLAFSTPNPALTPGATILLSRSAVCSQANVKNKETPPSLQRLVFEEYGVSKSQARAYEVDYLVTPALGGADDLRNLWPHSYASLWNARVKDALEDRLRDMVCDGTLDLADAQREIAGNWIDAYKKYFHTDHPLPEHNQR